jgi:hypothetical protein
LVYSQIEAPPLFVLGLGGRGWRTWSGSGRIYGAPRSLTPSDCYPVGESDLWVVSPSKLRFAELFWGEEKRKSFVRVFKEVMAGRGRGRGPRPHTPEEDFQLCRRHRNSSTSRRRRRTGSTTINHRRIGLSHTKLTSADSSRALGQEEEACRVEGAEGSRNPPDSLRCRSQTKLKPPESQSVRRSQMQWKVDKG